MDLQVTQENLNKALNNVARVATGRTTLPILNNVLIQTTNNQLRISATNLDIAISQQIGTKIKTEGSLTVPARLFQDFVSNLPKTTISLKQNENRLHLSAENYKSIINGTAIDDYPIMPALQSEESFTIPAQEMKQALQQVIFSAYSDESRPVLTAVYLYSYNGKLIIVATDSYRLAEKTIGDIDKEVKLLIPVSAMGDLLRIINEQSGDIKVSYDEQQVCFKVDNIELIARLIEGNYPDYKKLIPENFSKKAVVSKKELLTITKISGLFSRENAGSINVLISENSQSLSVKSIASQVGENESKTQGEVIGEGDITLNSRYLLDGLQAIEGEDVSFCFNEKLEAIIIKNEIISNYVHVIMPLKS